MFSKRCELEAVQQRDIRGIWCKALAIHKGKLYCRYERGVALAALHNQLSLFAVGAFEFDAIGIEKMIFRLRMKEGINHYSAQQVLSIITASPVIFRLEE